MLQSAPDIDHWVFTPCNKEKQEIYLKGAVPGARNGYLLIAGNGEIKIKSNEIKSDKEVVEVKVENKAEEVKEVEVEEVKEEKVEEK